MPHILAPDDIRTVLAELQAGIIPTSIFLNNHIEKKDPFKGSSINIKNCRKKRGFR